MSFNLSAKFYGILLVGALSAPSLLAKPLRAVGTIPDLAWLLKELGGSEVESSSLLSGSENPHYVDALPTYTLKVADADIVCMVGMELEVGYIGPILSRSGNKSVQVGSPNYCDASKQVKVLEKISGPVDRSMGDVHPHGNPHYYLSPTAMIDAASEIKSILSRMRSEKVELFAQNFESLKVKLSTLLKNNREKLKGIDRSKPLILEYHREFSYFYNDYDLKSFGSLEEKPGVSPSAGRIAEVALAAKKAGVKVLLATDYSPAHVLKRFSEIAKIPVLRVPTMIQAGTKFDTYEKIQSHIVESLVTHLSPSA